MSIIGTGDPRVAIYALREAIDAVEAEAWEEALGHIDVAEHSVKDARARAEELVQQ